MFGFGKKPIETEKALKEIEEEYYDITGKSPYEEWQDQLLFKEDAVDFLNRHGGS